MLTLEEENLLQQFYDDRMQNSVWRGVSEDVRDYYRDLFEMIKVFVLEDAPIETIGLTRRDMEDAREEARRETYAEIMEGS